MRKNLLWTLFFLFFHYSAANSRELVLDHSLHFGSEGSFNPIYYYFNTSFDVTRNKNYFHQDDPFVMHRRLFRRLKNPGQEIKNNGGTSKFLADEFFGLRAMPNYALHLVGGGYDFRALGEWYQLHGYSLPYLWAFLTSLAAGLGNEALETSAVHVKSTDHIADIYFFDLVGKWIFLSEDLTRFLYRDLGLRNWANQTVINVNNLKFFNSGNNYILRPTWNSKVLPFVYVTLGVMGGISYRLNEEDMLTVAMGISFTDPLEKKGKLSTAIFYDRRGSLLTSLFINTVNYKIESNIYPGIIPYKDWQIGTFFALDKENQPAGGIKINMPLGVGLE